MVRSTNMIRLYYTVTTLGRCWGVFTQTQRRFHQVVWKCQYIGHGLKSRNLQHMHSFTRKNTKERPSSWDKYSNKMFTEFLDMSRVDGFEQDKEFVKLEEILDKYEGTRNSTEFQIINLMHRHDKVEMVLDYIKFVRSKHELAPFTLYKAIESVTKTYPEPGLKLIHECIQKMPIQEMGLNFLITIIKNLLHTSDWKYGLQLVEENLHAFTDPRTPHEHGYLDSILAKSLLHALVNEDVDSYNKILNKYYMNFVTLQDGSQKDFLKHLQNGRIMPDIYLELLKNYQGFGLSYSEVPEIKKEFEKSCGDSVNIKLVKLTNGSCTCPACGEELQKPHFTEKELKQLEEGFIKTILKSEHVLGWNPQQELDRFYEYLWDMGPFDVVVDALNMMVGKIGIGPAQMKEMQDLMAEKLDKPKPKMLFITQRKKASWESYSKKLYLYNCNYNRSTDDLMVLLAALRSGRNTYFVSSDLYRDHVKDLTKQEFRTYIQWRQARQARFGEIHRRVVVMPNLYQSVTQETSRGWHVPFSKPAMYKNHGPSAQKGTLILPDNFMCVQKMEGWKPSPTYVKLTEYLRHNSRDKTETVT